MPDIRIHQYYVASLPVDFDCLAFGAAIMHVVIYILMRNAAPAPVCGCHKTDYFFVRSRLDKSSAAPSLNISEQT